MQAEKMKKAGKYFRAILRGFAKWYGKSVDSGGAESCHLSTNAAKDSQLFCDAFGFFGMVPRKGKPCQLSRLGAKNIAENVLRFSGYGTGYAIGRGRGLS
jgi:hypothetical protein